MIHIRGHPGDYSGYADMDNNSWEYEDILPYFDARNTSSPVTARAAR